jgi:hypothetical protein
MKKSIAALALALSSVASFASAEVSAPKFVKYENTIERTRCQKSCQPLHGTPAFFRCMRDCNLNK